ncbi:MAG: PulJ/GspJ family protein [Verrucomicrobiota bacterium]
MTTIIQKTSSRRAFTLVEIMVATVIMVIMVGLVIQITSEVLKVWNRSSGKLSANAQARIAMELITQDLETAVLRNNGQQWMRVETPTDVGSPAAGKTVALHLFAPALDRPEVNEDGDPVAGGDICAIAYRLAYAQSYDGANAPDTFALYRKIVDPETTFNEMMGPGSGNPQLELTGDPWDSTEVVVPENYLAGNIVDFQVVVYGENDAGDEIPLNADEDGELDDDFIFGGTNGSTETPIYMDVILTVLSDEGLELLELPSLAGTGYADVADIVREHGEVFTRRVNFMARPL